MSDLGQAAALIVTGFGRYFQCFQLMTQAARGLFEKAQWAEAQDIAKQRIDLYKEIVIELAAELQEQAGADCETTAFWQALKPVYQQQIAEWDNQELLETFYNSIFCYLFRHEQIDDDLMFVGDSTPSTPVKVADALINRYAIRSSIRALIYKILADYNMNIQMENIERDVRNIVHALKERVLPHMPEDRDAIVVEVLKSLFYRNKGAYLVGRISDGERTIPFVIPLINNERGAVYVDTAIFDTDDVSIIFSFTRSYFMVDTPVPGQIVAFLRQLMPNKEVAELYNAIGQNKHGKTEFYRSFLHHLQHSNDQFIIAPGIKGMVMSVFTLPSYEMVFKIIKDKFDPPKDMSREIVREKYRLVSRHDRVGRMADTQEYSHFRFPLARFSPTLMEELQKVAPSQLIIDGDELVIRHLYTERKMTPLNLYLQSANDEQIEEAMDEYGNAIKQIAAANIFPGDMLLKNFGVTRHGRVVFYDYDEICFLTECVFREIPEPQNDEQAMSSTPWYNVDPFDVFPEEFRLFFTGNPKAKRAFEKFHSDLYHVDFWRNLQERIRNGNMEDIFPYRRKKRFTRDLPAQRA
ncbi:MAG TPA: bifunctional isocitrate dehydrogenase kinase/phosphatase [Pseudomonadales bacterium]|nr:bifunctional isocitrate dehydrogenase kinase/phosphatase [Pseudomonadales bacterium]